jgi:hypothetical protein
MGIDGFYGQYLLFSNCFPAEGAGVGIISVFLDPGNRSASKRKRVDLTAGDENSYVWQPGQQ